MSDLQGRTVVVTGASSGIGAAAVARFAELGARVVVVGRSPEKTRAVADSIKAEYHTADFSRLDDVRALADKLRDRPIDVLANNAGGVFSGRHLTPDGHEMTFQVNYLAPFLLTNLLLPSLSEAQVINTGSVAYRFATLDLNNLDGLGGQRAYGAAKLAVLLFTRELARREEKLTATAFHPGGTATDVMREDSILGPLMRVGRYFLPSADKGAAPLIELATVADPESINGAYFNKHRRQEPTHKQVTDPEVGERLWDISARLTGLPAD
ncbi:MAG: short-chain dehydrogenase/reductase [Nocardia sp.]|uniref:SDR family NAD(P)-dependent oxidoreductase n=1 Tax=Nocardia sp. TaxID=1821 RepID=UPI00262B3DD2|nr:SDR family NAD(P)-dependent oxidoreductase [Nocardia sp.]MCU1642456.1 short-chain dehydrogenase/reductase [Nocardia sp.]